MERQKKILINTFLILVIYSLLFPKPTYAYLDPGSVSFVTQIIVAGVAGATYFAATSWKKIKSFFSKFFSKTDKSDKKDVSSKDSS